MILTKVENRQKRYRPNPERCRKVLDWFLRRAGRVPPPDFVFPAEISVLLVGNKAISAAHGAVFGQHGATDVISITYEALPGMDVGASAELLVNVERAVAEGRKRQSARWSPSHELALYIAHGIDHLTGAEDGTSAGRRRMRARELRWIRSAERAGLLRALLRVRSPLSPKP